MTQSEISNLYFRRQYLISPKEIECPFNNKLILINQTTLLYTHVDLKVNQIEENGRILILLGDLYDYENTNFGNREILNELIRFDFSNMIALLSKYCGRFVIISVENNSINIIHDAASSRKIYFIQTEEGVYCASQPHLIAKVLNLPLTKEKSRLDFYTSSPEIFKILHNSNIGDTTCYDNLYQVLPNHYFDYNNCRCIRYWPNKKREILSLDEVVNRCANMIKGYMESISRRSSVMLPVTAGKDSRLLLAATFAVRDSIYYYINKGVKMNEKHQDLIIAGRLLTRLNLKLNVNNSNISVDKDFEKVYFENNPFGSKPFLPIIYNYYLNFSDKINLPGTFSASGLQFFNTIGKTMSAETLASLIGVEKFDYAKKYFTNWLNTCKEVCDRYNYNIYNLLYWEERMANWGTEIQLNKDIAQDEIIPYNSRLFIETLLSGPDYSRERPDFIVIKEITRILWPETLLEPYNTNFKKKTLVILKTLGLKKYISQLSQFYYSVILSFLKRFK